MNFVNFMKLPTFPWFLPLFIQFWFLPRIYVNTLRIKPNASQLSYQNLPKPTQEGPFSGGIKSSFSLINPTKTMIFMIFSVFQQKVSNSQSPPKIMFFSTYTLYLKPQNSQFRPKWAKIRPRSSTLFRSHPWQITHFSWFRSKVGLQKWPKNRKNVKNSVFSVLAILSKTDILGPKSSTCPTKTRFWPGPLKTSPS